MPESTSWRQSSDFAVPIEGWTLEDDAELTRAVANLAQRTK
jgi:hypothetical protein